MIGKKRRATSMRLKGLKNELKSLPKSPAIPVKAEDLFKASSKTEKYLLTFQLKNAINMMMVRSEVLGRMRLILNTITIEDIQKESAYTRIKMIRIMADCWIKMERDFQL